MAEAKVGPMGLQCDKLQRDDLDHLQAALTRKTPRPWHEWYRAYNQPVQRREGTQKLRTCQKT